MTKIPDEVPAANATFPHYERLVGGDGEGSPRWYRALMSSRARWSRLSLLLT